jgi:hypothetical protein
VSVHAFILKERNVLEVKMNTCVQVKNHHISSYQKQHSKSSEVINSSTFLIALSMKSRARTCPAVLASSPVKRPMPAPSSSTDLPSNEGSKDRTYRKKGEHPYIRSLFEPTTHLVDLKNG